MGDMEEGRTGRRDMRETGKGKERQGDRREYHIRTHKERRGRVPLRGNRRREVRQHIKGDKEVERVQ